MRARAATALVGLGLLLGACGGSGDRAGAPPPAATTATAPPPERERFTRPFGAAVRADVVDADPAYRRALLGTFTSLTPENEMKWSMVHPQEDEWDFGAADELVEVAGRARMRVRGHTLVWDQQLPAWITRADLSPEGVRSALEEHVGELARRYRGRVESWDVVNEPFEDDGRWTRNVFHRALGRDYVAHAFRAARAADPDARLFLNDYAVERPGPKQDALVNLAAELDGEGLIDGVGLQNHTTAGDAPTRAELEATFARFTRLGLDVELTEMDVVRQGDADPVPAWRAAGAACAATERCTGLTVWGVTDKHSWLGADEQPLLFDARGRPKPGLGAVSGPLRP